MSTTAPSEIAPSAKARAIERNIALFEAHIAAVLDDPDAPPPDPVSVFLPVDDPAGFEEALALAMTYAREGYDVDLRHVHVRGRRPR